MDNFSVIKMIDTYTEQAAIGLNQLNIRYAQQYADEWNKILKWLFAQYGLAKKDPFFKQASTMKTFRYIHYYPEFEVIFHFNIDYFTEISQNIDAHAVILDFIQPYRKGATYMYDPVQDIKTSMPFNSAPVLAVPFCLSKDTSFLIVDGNHRISYAKQKAHQHISVRDFDIMSTLSGIMGEFEKALYTFIMEANIMRTFQNQTIPLANSAINLFRR